MGAGPAPIRANIALILQHWKADADLTGIRDETELSKLQPDERAAFKELWNDVDRLLLLAKASSQ
jgi:hypothetical protein